MDLPVWQALHTELGERLTVITVALDSGGAADAEPWIREAKPTHPSLIDVRHVVAELYGWVNVPTIAWIDEEGRLVRPGDAGWAGDYFRRMVEPDFDHAAMMAELTRLRARYLDAVRDWVAHGPASRWALAPGEVRRRLAGPDADHALAAAYFQLGTVLPTRAELRPRRRRSRGRRRCVPRAGATSDRRGTSRSRASPRDRSSGRRSRHSAIDRTTRVTSSDRGRHSRWARATRAPTGPRASRASAARRSTRRPR